jgi:hypothetical protein
MAAIINKASETYRNIMVICGYGQTRSIPYYLYYSEQANSENNIQEVCKFKPPFESLIRKDNPETQIDKLVIIDQLLGIANPNTFH